MSDTTITPEERAELRELAAKATPGPWAFEPHGDTGSYGVGVVLDDNGQPIRGLNTDNSLLVSEPVAPEVLSPTDAAYIATACNLAPRLLNALEAAEARAIKLKAEIDANGKDYCALMDRHDAQFVRAEEAKEQLRKEEAHSEELESQLQDAESKYNANWAVQTICDVAHLLDVLEQCRGTGDDIGAATLEAVQDLKAEKARLTAELETARQVAASAHTTAQTAWGGEIPSPLPGHKHMAEDDLAAMDAHLDCPLCGGSGHIGDCDATAAGEVARLNKDNARQLMVSKALARKLAQATRTWGKAGKMDNSAGYWMTWAEHDVNSEIEAARRAVAVEGEVRG